MGKIEKECFSDSVFGKLGVVRVLTSQWGFTRPSSVNFSMGIVRDIVPPIIQELLIKISLLPEQLKRLKKKNSFYQKI